MIDVTTLQLGNLVYNHRHWICPVIGLKDGEVTVIAKHYGESTYRSDIIYPIPITREILEKCFPTHTNKKCLFETYNINDDFMIEDRSSEDDAEFCVCHGSYPTASYWTCTIKYFHELQNILKLHKINIELQIEQE